MTQENFSYQTLSGVTALSANIRDFVHKKHSHEEYSLGVTLHGTQEFYINGETHAIKDSGVMLFNPGDLHCCLPGKRRTNLVYTMLYIQPELFAAAADEKYPLRLTAPVSHDSKLARDIINLSTAVQHSKNDSLCHELLIKLCSNFTSRNHNNRSSCDNSFLQKAKDMIYCELGCVLKLDNIAAEFNMTKFQFIRNFKAHTGMSPYQFFLNSKIIRARKHLEAERDLYATVLKFGFVDLSHLNRHFKRIFGVTAHEYLTSSRG